MKVGRRMQRMAAASWLCVLAACGEAAGPSPSSAVSTAQAQGAAPTPAPAAVTVEEALHYDPVDPLADLERADALDRGAGRMPAANLKAPARGCVVVAPPRRVWSSPGPSSVAALGDEFLVVGYAPDAAGGEKLFAVRVLSSGGLEPVTAQRIEPPYLAKRVAPPAVAARDAHAATLAFVDGAGVLFLEQVELGRGRGAGARRELGRGVDARFAPAVTHVKGGALVAYTLGQTPMRTLLARTGPRGELVESHDVTPAAMAAAAPAFVAGAEPPLLVTADPRDGMSPIARTQLDAEGRPAPAEVAAPVSMMSQPAQLTAATGRAGTFVGYTGLGAAATSAVGLVQILPKGGAPEALVKGIAYGPLHVSAASLGAAVVFAADTPLSAGKSPAHDVTLTRVDARGRGTALHIAGPTGDASSVSIARAKSGAIAVVFTANDGVYFAQARCDEAP